MSGIITAVAAVAAVATAGITYVQGQDAAKQQKDAQNQAAAQAAKQEKTAEEQYNKANQKSADVSGVIAAAQQAAKQGGGGTMLTGNTGVAPSSLTLGKTSLLGS